MADSHGPEGHHGPAVSIYLIVFAALCVFTAASFVVNAAERTMEFGVLLAMAIILIIAVCKATLVIMYFMHVKWDWGKLYFLIIPVVILAIMMMVVLLPDQVISWHNEP